MDEESPKAARTAELRRAVNATRARLEQQRLAAAALRDELAVLRRLARERAASAPRTPRARRAGARARHAAAVAALALAAVIVGRFPAPPAVAKAPPAPAVRVRPPALPRPGPEPALAAPAGEPRSDDGGDDAARALLLAQRWRAPDGLSLDERFGDPSDPPGAPKTWRTERVGERRYAVIRREPSGAEDEIVVDLELGRVQPAGRTRRRLSGYLLSRR